MAAFPELQRNWSRRIGDHCRRWHRPLLLVALFGLAVRGGDPDGKSNEVSINPHESAEGGSSRGPSIDGNALSEHHIKNLHLLVDTNGDGFASIGEFEDFGSKARGLVAQKEAKTLFKEMDINQDGQVDSEEFRKEIDKWAQIDDPDERESGLRLELLKFQAADANRDGRLNSEEMAALIYPDMHPGVFAVVVDDVLKKKDRGGDGELTPNEFFARSPEEGMDLGITDQELADFEQLDLDDSGKLDAEELTIWESGRFDTYNALKAMFAIADKNADGYLSEEELWNERQKLAGSEVHSHFIEWMEHHNEL